MVGYGHRVCRHITQIITRAEPFARALTYLFSTTPLPAPWHLRSRDTALAGRMLSQSHTANQLSNEVRDTHLTTARASAPPRPLTTCIAGGEGRESHLPEQHHQQRGGEGERGTVPHTCDHERRRLCRQSPDETHLGLSDPTLSAKAEAVSIAGRAAIVALTAVAAVS